MNPEQRGAPILMDQQSLYETEENDQNNKAEKERRKTFTSSVTSALKAALGKKDNNTNHQRQPSTDNTTAIPR